MALIESALDANDHSRVVDALLQTLIAHYVYPDVARAMEQDIRQRMANGDYNGITSGPTLADLLTNHLQKLSRDGHLHVFFNTEPRLVGDVDEPIGPTPEEREEQRQAALLHNCGFYRVERLSGNVGYLDLRGLYAPEWAGEVAANAMNLLANTDVLIIDLRHNTGGHAATVALLASYLIDGSAELSGIYWRAYDRTNQSWTVPFVPGKRYSNKSVYILTSGITFSAAEAFAYDLKHLKRATIIGEITGGGAHLPQGFQIHPHFCLAIPTGRAINPLTGTNWEGTGVIPDIAVPQEQAFTTAYIRALKSVIEAVSKNPTSARKAVVEEARVALAKLDRNCIETEGVEKAATN
jgi:retinol-binding protein 3